MRTFLGPIVALAAGAAAALWSSPGPARAQAVPASVAISGLHVDGVRREATVTLTNVSTASADFYAINVSFFYADGNRAANVLTPPQPLLAGRSVTIDVAGAVNAAREAFGVAPFKGPVQVIVTGSSCEDSGTCPPGAVPRPFGPEVIQVSARQREGNASYDAAFVWSSAP